MLKSTPDTQIPTIRCSVAEVGEVALSYRTRGSDSVVVCLHGIQANRSVFAKLMAEPLFSRMDVAAIDLPGFGESSKPTEWDYGVDSFAGVVTDILQQLNHRRVHLIGHSLGGMIGTLLLQEPRLEVMSFVNLEGNMRLEDCGASRKVGALTFEQFTKGYFPELKKSLYASSDSSASFRAAALEQISETAFFKTSNQVLRYSESGKLQEIFESAQQPRLFLFGSRSHFQTRVADPRCRQAEIPNASHFMLLENYPAVVAEISKFFAQL